MAKKKTDYEKMLDELRKTTESTTFEDSVYGEVHSYIDTGSYALNRIICGDIYGGIPQGRTIVLGGESSTGKSLVCARIVKNAQDAGFKHIFYLDSEGGGLKQFFLNVGCSLHNIEHVVVATIEETSVFINQTLVTIKEYRKNHPKDQFLIILDSLGNLNTQKFYDDAKEGKQTGDMGLRARACNVMMSSTVVPALRADTAFIAVNHVYADPKQMYPSKIMNQSGGKKLQYVGTINVQFTRSLEASDDKTKKEDLDKAHFKGSDLKFFTVKNRLIKPFLSAEMYISFTTGIARWDGLIKPAIEYGFIEQAGAWYSIPSWSEKKVQKPELIRNDEIWATFIDEFNEVSKKNLAYASVQETEEYVAEVDVVASDDGEEFPEMA